MSEQSAIAFNSVSKSFGKRTVLKDVSFSIAAGTAFVLLGRSGTGKSVTLKLICGLLKADSGSVTVNGTDITKLESNELAKGAVTPSAAAPRKPMPAADGRSTQRQSASR